MNGNRGKPVMLCPPKSGIAFDRFCGGPNCLPKANNHLFVRFQTGNALANALLCLHRFFNPRPHSAAAPSVIPDRAFVFTNVQTSDCLLRKH